MKLLSPADFSLRLLRQASNDNTASGELVIKGKPSGKMIDCAVLAAALDWTGMILAFFTDGVPYEEFLQRVLFDQKRAVLDAARLGAMYSTGVFSDLALCPPDEMRFRFIGGITWTLQLMDRSRFVLPSVSDATGVARPFGFFRRFKVIGTPLPGTGMWPG